ncbi:DUF84 family protein [Planococcus shenhongbingii]|uniref:inosine/xanthosine triphosphatase n=1 Tax=Planococcus shenhongbingii TaxID=3058398 RepID=A0ABT8NDS7_9BACL|nr:DUF84 family protein [Planococcus sp. N017]MDN7246045.1 DUF84 family protein [Planococcus sp. N017]
MKKIKAAIASGNPAKVNAVTAVFEKFQFDFELVTKDVDSGVSAQPITLEETRLGAINRSKAALTDSLDVAIGLEGGVYELEGEMYLCNWGALATSEGRLYTAAGAQIPLPEEIALRLRAGNELGLVMDEYADEIGVRTHKGAIGILTAEYVNRNEMFEHIVSLLLGQYIQGSDSVASAPKHL